MSSYFFFFNIFVSYNQALFLYNKGTGNFNFVLLKSCVLLPITIQSKGYIVLVMPYCQPLNLNHYTYQQSCGIPCTLTDIVLYRSQSAGSYVLRRRVLAVCKNIQMQGPDYICLTCTGKYRFCDLTRQASMSEATALWLPLKF